MAVADDLAVNDAMVGVVHEQLAVVLVASRPRRCGVRGVGERGARDRLTLVGDNDLPHRATGAETDVEHDRASSLVGCHVRHGGTSSAGETRDRVRGPSAAVRGNGGRPVVASIVVTLGMWIRLGHGRREACGGGDWVVARKVGWRE
jgi:hypothetical protein